MNLHVLGIEAFGWTDEGLLFPPLVKAILAPTSLAFTAFEGLFDDHETYLALEELQIFHLLGGLRVAKADMLAHGQLLNCFVLLLHLCRQVTEEFVVSGYFVGRQYRWLRLRLRMSANENVPRIIRAYLSSPPPRPPLVYVPSDQLHRRSRHPVGHLASLLVPFDGLKELKERAIEWVVVHVHD